MNITTKERLRYRQIILERSKNPRNLGQTDPIHLFQKGKNPYCSDRLEISITLDEKGQKIIDLKFQGSGCALCLASADLMADVVKGKSIAEALAIVEHFHQVILDRTELMPSLYKLKAIEGVKRYPIKVKCTTLAWHTLKAAILID